MALRQSDIQIHNNPNLAVVDSDFVKGGFRTAVAVKSDLYALSGKTDEPSAAGQLKEYATIVYVTGEMKYYVLVDVDEVDNAAGWEEFVAGGAGTLTGATNGLSLFSGGTSVGLGGALSGDTLITLDNHKLSFGDYNNEATSLEIDGITNTIYLGVNTGNTYILIDSIADDIELYTSGGSKINLDGLNNKIEISGGDGFSGAEYDVDYSANYTARSIPDVGWITGHTSGITGTITGGTNGLGEIGKDVCLGGALLNNTTINPNGYDLNLSGATGSISSFIGSPTSYSCASVSSSCVSFEKVSTTNCAFIDITGTTITTCAKGGNLIYNTNGCMMITVPSGATYAGCYHSNYTDRTLVDKEYVDNSKSHVCVVVTDTDPYYITGLDIVYVGVSGVTEDRVYLPSGTSLCIGRKITIADVCGEALTHRVIIDGAGKCINNNGCAVINTDYGSITLLYNGYFWSPISFVN